MELDTSGNWDIFTSGDNIYFGILRNTVRELVFYEF